ncbi:MAG: hypothetical protein KDA97_04560 [Acidimicrobiales bacterium]|jgi:hypothetical protein|nr:hypothetical protein [Acidimicrobiales bacterium]
MADTDVEPTERETADSPAETKRTGRRWIALAIVVAVLAVGGVAAAVIATRDDGPSYDTAQIGWMHQGCQEWADTYQGGDGPSAGWCSSRTDWMNGQMGQRQGGMMMGSMMWQDPDSMRATCQQWMAEDPGATNGGGQWCDQMVDWMSDHMGDWDQWMRNGPMMGGS